MNVPLLDVNAQNLPLEGELSDVFTKVLRSGRFILGEEVEAFERECATAIGAKHAISISSGTDALLVAMMALNLGPGDEVLCPSFTFFATAGCIARMGATPVFCDVYPDSFNIDLSSMKAKVTKATKAIVPVHLFGQVANMDEILAFAKEHNLAVIEDVAQSIGATYKGKGAGTMGEFGCYSFFPSKNLGGFGDGGLVTTENDSFAEAIIRLRNHGMHPRYHHSMIGGNFRMDALQCALLRVKLRRLTQYAEGRARNAAYYREQLSGIDGLILPQAAAHNGHVWNQFTLRVPGQRDLLKEHLAQSGVASEIYYPIPLHRQQCFAQLPTHALEGCPVSDALAAEVLSIPIYPELNAEQLARVAEVVRSFRN